MMSKLKEQNRLARSFMQGDFSSQLWISAVAFPVLMVLGFVVGIIVDDLAANFLTTFTGQLADSGVVDEDGTIQLLPLLYNNLRAALFTIGYGFIPMVFLPALSLGVNALLLGFFAAYYFTNGMSMLYYFAAILPHGIFELPALVLSVALGLYLCRIITDYVRYNKKGIVVPTLYNILRVYLLRAVPLFVVASVVECYITPWIITLI